MSGSSLSRRRHLVSWAGAAAILVAAMAIPSGSARAADEPWAQLRSDFDSLGFAAPGLPRQELAIDRFAPPAPVRRQTAPASNRFFRGHFMPRMSRQFAEIVPIEADYGETDFAESVRFATVSEIARARAERGTEKAVRDYLLEVSTLERTFDAVKIPTRKRFRDGRAGGMSLGFHISGGLPQLEMRQRTGFGALRLRVGPQGTVGLEFKQIRHRYSRVYVGYDAEDARYGLGCRFSF